MRDKRISPGTASTRRGRPNASPRRTSLQGCKVKGVFIEREAISKIETGDRFVTDYELMIFAEVLGVTMDWLTGKE